MMSRSLLLWAMIASALLGLSVSAYLTYLSLTTSVCTRTGILILGAAEVATPYASTIGAIAIGEIAIARRLLGNSYFSLTR